MTSVSTVKNELALLTEQEPEAFERYTGLIDACLAALQAQLVDGADENDARVQHLAVATCYYRILLLERAQGVTDFRVGDISYSMSSADPAEAKALYVQAQQACAALLQNGAFAFQAV